MEWNTEVKRWQPRKTAPHILFNKDCWDANLNKNKKMEEEDEMK